MWRWPYYSPAKTANVACLPRFSSACSVAAGVCRKSVVFAVVVAVAVLSTCSNFSAFYSSQQVVGARCFFRRYRSGCCKWSALAASLVQWPRGDLIMPVKTLVRCAPILLDDTVPRVFGFVAGVYGHAPWFDIGLVFCGICLWPTCAGCQKLDTCTKCLLSMYFEM